MSTSQPRKPAGTPSGGQWAPMAHAETDVELAQHYAAHTVISKRIAHIACLFDGLPQDRSNQSKVWKGTRRRSPFALRRDDAQGQLRRLMPRSNALLPTSDRVDNLSQLFLFSSKELLAYKSECEELLARTDSQRDKIERGIGWAERYIDTYTEASAKLKDLAGDLRH